MINNNYEYLKFLQLIFVVLIFLFVYFFRFDIVGHFPSESLIDLHEISIENINASPTYSKKNSKNFPEFVLDNQLSVAFLREIDKSPNILFDERKNKLILNGPLHHNEYVLLEKILIQDNSENNIDFIFSSIMSYKFDAKQKFYSNPITEEYWASKGSSVLHHWMHLLDSSSVHYGTLLRSLSDYFSKFFNKNGPTLEVKIAWIILFFVAPLYSFIFLKLFNNHVLAYPLLLLKLYFFQKIGLFLLLLGPGFHWLRDLVILLTPILIIWLNNYYKKKIHNKKFTIIPYLKISTSLLLLFLLSISDQTFFSISLLSILIVFIVKNLQQIYLSLKQYIKYALVIIFIITATNYFFKIIPSTNLSYAINLFVDNNNLIVLNNDYILFLLKIATLITFYVFYLYLFEKDNFYGFYFSISSLMLIFYVLSMPDGFHLDKYLSLIIPTFFYMFLSLKNIIYILFSQFSFFDRIRNRNMDSLKIFIFLIYLATTFSLVFINMYQAYKYTKPNLSELSLYSMFDKKIYLNVKDLEINGKFIKANISGNLYKHLSSFPISQEYDFIISPFDKYISAIYKKSNGFGNVDLVRSSDTSLKVEKFKSLINSKTPSFVILDEKILDLNTEYLWPSTGYYGYLANSSKFDYKAQLRVSNLAQNLLDSCEHLNKNENWLLLKCF